MPDGAAAVAEHLEGTGVERKMRRGTTVWAEDFKSIVALQVETPRHPKQSRDLGRRLNAVFHDADEEECVSREEMPAGVSGD